MQRDSSKNTLSYTRSMSISWLINYAVWKSIHVYTFSNSVIWKKSEGEKNHRTRRIPSQRWIFFLLGFLRVPFFRYLFRNNWISNIITFRFHTHLSSNRNTHLVFYIGIFSACKKMLILIRNVVLYILRKVRKFSCE